MSLLPPRQRVARSLAAGAVVLTTALATTSLASASTADRQSGKPTGPERSTQAAEARGHYDARYGQSGSARAATYREASKASRSSVTRALQASIPGQAIFDIDGTTGTVRILERLDGYLTGKSNLKPTRVVAKYLDANHDALGLTKSDLKTFKLKRDYKDIEGVHHLFWIQRIGGKTVFGNGLTAAVTKDGRLLTLGGSPVSKAHLPAPANTKIESGSEAIANARASLGATDSAAGASDSAEQVLFVTPRGSYVGWLTTIMSVQHPATQVVDSVSGRLLYRNPLGNDAAGEATGTAFPNHPGAAHGGKQITVNYTRNGWLPRGATKLSGNNSHTYSDVNDDNEANPSEEVHPNAGLRWNDALKPFKVKGMSFCKQFPCSWDPDDPFSWKVNRDQNAAQVFYFVNKFHDHLQGGPDRLHRGGRQLPDRQRVQAGQGPRRGRHADHGRRRHRQRPAGRRPRRQRQHGHPARRHPADDADVPAARRRAPPTRDGDPFSATNTGDEAWTVYHEYTHGLSNRLVVDVPGNSTLGPIQGDAMGEAWSDWFAADEPGPRRSRDRPQGQARPRPVQVRRWRRSSGGLIRTQSIDCTPSSPGSRLPGWPQRPQGRLHLRRLRQDPRCRRGARRRRDLGRDPLVAARQDRLPGRPEPGHPGHGALGAQPVVPRHAQRAARRRHGPLQGQVPPEDLEHLRLARHGLLRRIAGRRRRPAGRELQEPAEQDQEGRAHRHRRGLRDRSAGGGRSGHPGVPGPRDRQPDGHHGRRRHLQPGPGPDRLLRQARDQRSGLRPDHDSGDRGQERLPVPTSRCAATGRP